MQLARKQVKTCIFTDESNIACFTAKQLARKHKISLQAATNLLNAGIDYSTCKVVAVVKNTPTRVTYRVQLCCGARVTVHANNILIFSGGNWCCAQNPQTFYAC